MPLAGAGGAARAMEVVLGVLRRVVVHHDADVVDVEATGGDVGGDQDGQPSGRELGERPLPMALVEVAVDGRGGDALLLQRRTR